MLCVEKQYFYETTRETRVTKGEENNTATKITYKSNHVNAQSKNVKAQRFLYSASINDNEPSLYRLLHRKVRDHANFVVSPKLFDVVGYCINYNNYYH